MRVYGDLVHAKPEILSSDPSDAGDLYSGRMWFNSTDKQMKIYDGFRTQAINHNYGDLTVSTGTKTLHPGTYVFNSLTVASGATLNIADNEGRPCIIYVLGDASIEGTINYKQQGEHFSLNLVIPIPGTVLTPSITQSSGGDGGTAGNTATSVGGSGGSGSAQGYGGGGGGGAADAVGTGANGGAGGSGNGADGAAGEGSGTTGGAGGTGRNYTSDSRSIHFQSSTEAGVNIAVPGVANNGGAGAGGGGGGGRVYAGGGANYHYAGGGGGGAILKGKHGGVIVLYVLGEVSGSGTIDVSGSAGSAGAPGGTFDANAGEEGGAGGGGGSAGGSGGHIYIYYGVSDSFTANGNRVLSGGAGGAGGAGRPGDGTGGTSGEAGSSGGSGANGTYTSTQIS